MAKLALAFVLVSVVLALFAQVYASINWMRKFAFLLAFLFMPTVRLPFV